MGEHHNITADLYYAALNGSWNDNGNSSRWGEPGEADLLAEVYVGRAPVDSAYELTNFTMKTIAYERTTADYLREAWMVGSRLDAGGVADWGGNFKDEIKYGSGNHGYCTVGVPPYFDVETLYDRDYPGNNWPNAAIKAKINNGLHIINSAGHGNPWEVMKMYYTDAYDLTNTDYFFGYAYSCEAGSFDNYCFETEQYHLTDCIIEHFVTSEHGAFAYVGSSRYTWDRPDTTDSSTQRLEREFWDAVFGEGKLHLGEANQDSKEDNNAYINDYNGAMRWDYYAFNLLGDPETSIRIPAHDTDILIVDDDVSEIYEKYYMNALHAKGYNWDNCSAPQDASVLLQYPVVIWLTGDDWMFTLRSNDRANLQTYLDSGGNLFISGQDIGVDIRNDPFYADYLHADYIDDDTEIYTLNGVTGDPIGDGLTIGISGGDGANNQGYPSEIAPGDETASAVFNYAGDGCGAIKADTGTYKVVYFAFGFEAINNEADRNTVMSRVMRWLKPELITNCDALQDMNTNLAGNYYLGTDIDCSGTAGWNGGAGFVPVGNYDTKFTGTFDGRGHKITGLFIDRPSTWDVGLFDYAGTGSEIKDVGLEDVSVNGYKPVGSLVGHNKGIISNSYSTGSVNGDWYIGGLLGYNGYGTVENSYSMCNVDGAYLTGGLLGFNECGTVTNSYSTGSVSGINRIGGLVGLNYYGTVSNSYSTGSVSGSEEDIGGLIGYGGGATHSYWDIETSGQSSSAGGEGKTTAEMKQEATFVGWDFTNIWAIREEVTYPFLRWEVVLPDLVITKVWVNWPVNCSIFYNITNIGEATAPAGHTTVLFVDDVKRAEDVVSMNIPAGESCIRCFNDYTWIHTPPSDKIAVCANFYNVVPEG